jgi:class 3 adenylate cyclase
MNQLAIPPLRFLITFFIVAIPTAAISFYYMRNTQKEFKADPEIKSLFVKELNDSAFRILLSFSIFTVLLYFVFRINDAQRYVNNQIIRDSRDLQLVIGAACLIFLAVPMLRKYSRLCAVFYCFGINAVVVFSTIGGGLTVTSAISLILPTMAIAFLLPAPSYVMSALGFSMWLTGYIVFEVCLGPGKEYLISPLMTDVAIFYFCAILIGAFTYHLKQREIVNRVQLAREKEKSDGLLHNIFPEDVVRELKEKGSIEARRYEEATILFADIVGFTAVAEHIDPSLLVSWLHDIFSKYDTIAGRYGLEKLKTIGDCYMTVCGVPVTNSEHALQTVRAAFEMLDEVRKYQPEGIESPEESFFKMRIGIHSGPVVAGVIGDKKYSYDVWGDNVNIASRLEAAGSPMRINVSKQTADLIKDHYKCTSRGLVEVRNRAALEMFWVDKFEDNHAE